MGDEKRYLFAGRSSAVLPFSSPSPPPSRGFPSPVAAPVLLAACLVSMDLSMSAPVCVAAALSRALPLMLPPPGCRRPGTSTGNAPRSVAVSLGKLTAASSLSSFSPLRSPASVPFPSASPTVSPPLPRTVLSRGLFFIVSNSSSLASAALHQGGATADG